MNNFWNIGLRTVIIALASYGFSVLCSVDAMARRAWRGDYWLYMSIFLILSTFAILFLSLIERKNSLIARPILGFIFRAASCWIASWIALVCVSYALATAHNRETLEFMRVGAHVALGLYFSGALFYGICLATISLCVAHLKTEDSRGKTVGKKGTA